MVDPTMLIIWTALGLVVGWCSGQYLFGYRLIDDLIGGAFGSILGGVAAHALFGDTLGGPLGSIALGAVLALSLILALRVLPHHHFT